MRHTVIGIFDTYDQAEVARSALVASGFARSDIELQAAPQPSSPDDPAWEAGAGQPPETGGVLANIERFFSMLFGGRDQPPEVAHYSIPPAKRAPTSRAERWRNKVQSISTNARRVGAR
jgi:hypothetical protein